MKQFVLLVIGFGARRRVVVRNLRRRRIPIPNKEIPGSCASYFTAAGESRGERPGASDVAGMLEMTVRHRWARRQQTSPYVTRDGKKIIDGKSYDARENPFARTRQAEDRRCRAWVRRVRPW
jgi:hypothetical protein